MSDSNYLYDDGFYDSQVRESVQSARKVVPVLAELFSPSSVLDVGSGIGTWGSVWLQLTDAEVVGVDGEYIDRQRLLIPTEKFVAADLTESFDLGRSFDLVTCLEVAEHLPSSAAATLVDSICRHSSTVVFSAAIPGQPGLHHVNLQWQSYWAELFAERGFKYFDEVRRRIWTDREVAAYYRQNIMVFSSTWDHEAEAVEMADVVHPEIYSSRVLVPLTRVIEQRLRRYNVRTRMRSSIRQLKARFSRHT